MVYYYQISSIRYQISSIQYSRPIQRTCIRIKLNRYPYRIQAIELLKFKLLSFIEEPGNQRSYIWLYRSSERQDPEGVVLSSIDDLVLSTSRSTTGCPDTDEG